MTDKSQVIMKDELADMLDALHRARPDMAEAFDLVRVAVGIGADNHAIMVDMATRRIVELESSLLTIS